MKKKIFAIIGCVLLLSGVATCVRECGNDNAVGRFGKQMDKGNLTKAERCLADISDYGLREDCALRLIREYTEANATAKAIHVYEDLTPEHLGRSRIDSYGSSYERKACKMISGRLIKDGDYENAWEYYPVSSDDENSLDNADDLFAYMSDVVAAMCAEGRQEDAVKFVEWRLRWFVNNVDMDTSGYDEDMKTTYNSEAVRAKLQEQINNSY